ncbi:hypothetical protein BKA93DRAFT_747042 [Sparassis latifolia]
MGTASVAEGTRLYSVWEMCGHYVWFDVRSCQPAFDMLMRGEDIVRIAKFAKAGIASYILSETAVVKGRTEYETKRPPPSILSAYIGGDRRHPPMRLPAARQEGTDEKSFDDMFDRLLSRQDENRNPIGPEELTQTAEAIMLLVHNVQVLTSFSLSAIICYMAHEQEVQKKPLAELDTVANILEHPAGVTSSYCDTRTSRPSSTRVSSEGGYTGLGHAFPEDIRVTYSLHHSNEAERSALSVGIASTRITKIVLGKPTARELSNESYQGRMRVHVEIIRKASAESMSAEYKNQESTANTGKIDMNEIRSWYGQR